MPVYNAARQLELARFPDTGKTGVELMSKLFLRIRIPGSCRGHRCLSLLLLLVCLEGAAGFAASVQAATFTATLDRDSLTVGEAATLSLTFGGGTPLSIPSPPPVGGLQIDYLGQSTQISIVQGQSSSTVTHSFRVVPREAGDFVIGSLTAEVGGEKLTTQPLKLKATKPGAPSADAINSGSQVAFIKLVLPKKQFYLGETIVVQVDLYLSSVVQNIRGFQLTSFPADGLNVGKMVQGNQRRTQLGNSIYTVIPLSFPLKPFKTGALNIGPVTASFVADLASGRRRGDPFFDQFGFSFGGEQKQLALTTEMEPVQALPLPADNVPANFGGAVGSFSLNFTAGPTNVAAGDPITVHVQLSGRGAFDAINLPEQLAWRDFKTYPPSSKVETTDPFGLQGSKTFEEVVVPQSADIKELPGISFSFFDPEQRSYRTLTQPPVKLTVRPGGVSAPTIATANRSAAQESPVPALDIVQIKSRLGTFAQATPPVVTQPWFLALQSVPALALLSAVALRRRADNLANNPRLRRQRLVAHIIREGLIEIRKLAAENKSTEFFAAVFRLLQEQLGERLDLPASAITEAVIEERLRPRNVPEATLNQVQELFQVCNLARYAPFKTSQELAAVIPKLESTLNSLQSLKL